jgi:Mg2+/Co2+ transporter CorB
MSEKLPSGLGVNNYWLQSRTSCVKLHAHTSPAFRSIVFIDDMTGSANVEVQDKLNNIRRLFLIEVHDLSVSRINLERSINLTARNCEIIKAVCERWHAFIAIDMEVSPSSAELKE